MCKGNRGGGGWEGGNAGWVFMQAGGGGGLVPWANVSV